MTDPDLPTRIATWLTATDHDRPFFRDPDFLNAFGRPGPAMLRAAVDELWKRADSAAYAASHPISLPPRLGGSEQQERN